jgi:hypothetical protein
VETAFAWIISIVVLGFIGLATVTYAVVFIDAIKKARKPKVKVPGRRGWFN